MECLFVYGTLRSDMGHPMHDVLNRYAQFVGMGTVWGRLFNLGTYPGLILVNHPKESTPLSDAGSVVSASKVWGEVYALTPDTTQILLAILDDYEGYYPGHRSQSDYLRQKVQVLMESKGAIAPETLSLTPSLEAWGYVYNRDVAAYPELPSGNYADYV